MDTKLYSVFYEDYRIFPYFLEEITLRSFTATFYIFEVQSVDAKELSPGIFETPYEIVVAFDSRTQYPMFETKIRQGEFKRLTTYLEVARELENAVLDKVTEGLHSITSKIIQIIYDTTF